MKVNRKTIIESVEFDRIDLSKLQDLLEVAKMSIMKGDDYYIKAFTPIQREQMRVFAEDLLEELENLI